jgi:anti-anti-sigma factor
MASSPALLIQSIRDVTIVTVDQRTILEPEEVQRFGGQLLKLVTEQACRKLVIDMAKVHAMSSSTLGALIQLKKQADAIKGKIILCGLRKEQMEVFRISRLHKMFTFCDDEEQALSKFGVTTAG